MTPVNFRADLRGSGTVLLDNGSALPTRHLFSERLRMLRTPVWGRTPDRGAEPQPKQQQQLPQRANSVRYLRRGSDAKIFDRGTLRISALSHFGLTQYPIGRPYILGSA